MKVDVSKIKLAGLKVKKVLRFIRAFFPSAVPIGMTDFDSWAYDIIDLYNLPNNDSVRFALATMIMHSGPTAAYKSKFYFNLMIKASMAKQIASAKFQEIKTKQQEEIAKQKAAEATAIVVPSANESK